MEVIEKIIKNEKNIKHDIYVLKVLMLCQTDTENQKKLDYIEKKSTEMSSNIMLYELKVNEQKSSTELTSLYNQITNDCDTILDLISEIKDDVFPRFKLASMIIIDNMSNDVLENFYEEVRKALSNFNNIEEASDYYYYHTGEQLSDFIVDLLDYIKEAPERVLRLIPISYFESKKTIITLSFKNWFEIFNNIRFTLKYVGNYRRKEYLDLMEKYRVLEVYYFIIITGYNKVNNEE